MNQPITACLVCGAPLVYRREAVEMTCARCGKPFLSHAACENGHYICDACHGSAGRLAIRWHCARAASRNPVEIAREPMALPAVHMHGPEHHALVGSALLTAYRNSGGPLDLEPALDELERRSRAVPGGACGLWGTCGAAVSAGMFFSVAAGTTPLSGPQWGLANRMTAACLEAIGAVGGPRCCKRNTFLAIRTAVPFAAEHLGVTMELPSIRCTHAPRNRECLGIRCPFHAGV